MNETSRFGERMQIFKRLLELVRPFRWWLGLAILLNFATLGSGIGLMAFSAYLISKSVLVSAVADVALVSVGVRFFAISRAALRYCERYVTHTITFRILARLRAWFFQSIEPFAPARLQSYYSGDLFARIGSDIEALQDFYVRVLVPPVAAALTVLLASIILGSFAPWLGFVLLCFLLLTGLVLPAISRCLSRQPASRIALLRAQLQSSIADAIQGDAELLVFGQSAAQQARIKQLDQELHNEQQRMAHIRALGIGLGSLFTGAAGITILGLALPLVSSGQIAGEFLALLPLTAIASFEAVQPLSQAMQQLEQSKAAARRIFELSDAPTDSAALKATKTLPSGYDIRIRDLWFRYSEARPWVLKQVDLAVAEGERAIITGASGAGKSSLVALLLGFWPHQRGSIQIGGRELRELDPEAARQLFSVVSQQTYLFNSTLRDNLLLARAEASDEELLVACEAAQLGELIARLPHGLDTLVGENGMQLSGGERQRVALARAILKNAPILILDEASNNLDPLTAQAVEAALADFAQGRTTLIFCHQSQQPVALHLDSF